MKMTEYIEREAAIQAASIWNGDESTEAWIKSALKKLPAADVRPVVRATWEKVTEQPYFRKHYHVVACSACHKRGNQGWNFCPNCGADMREES